MLAKFPAGEKVFDVLWLCFWLGLSSCWILGAAANVGATFDEPLYLNLGLEFWRTGSHYELMRVGTMPLPVDLATLPAYLYERYSGTPFELSSDAFPQVLFYCRAMILLFWALLLVFARIVATELGGPWAGRLALAYLACEPNFLAHASLMTADIALTAMLLPTLYFFSKNRSAGWLRRVLLPAFWFGACLISKASGLVYVPLGMFIIELARLARDGVFQRRGDGNPWTRAQLWARFAQPLFPFLRDATRIFAIGLLLAFLYCGSDWKVERTWVKWAHQLPEGTFKDAMVSLSENVRIFNNAGVGIARQVTHNIRGHGSYILGRTDPRAIWYYYPVLLTIKLTLPILILPVLLLVLDRRSLVNWACLVAAALLVYSLNCRVQIGIRLMLPWIAVGIVGLCAAAVRAWQREACGWRPACIMQFCCLGLVWNVAAAWSHWPNGLCYVNELWGGTPNGYRLISDSNYDWGQGVPDLDKWLASRGNPPLDLLFFGTDPRVHRLPLRVMPYQTYAYHDFLKEVRGRYLAVGTVLLYGSYIDQQSEMVQHLRRMQPIDRTATFLIFDFTQPAELADRSGQNPDSSRRY